MMMDSRFRGDIAGGLTSAVITLPVAIACGLLVFLPLGPEYAAMGAAAGLYGAVFASIAAVLVGSTPTQITGPKLSIAIILTALVGDLGRNPMFSGADGPDIGLIISLVFATIFLAGILQFCFGLFRIGHLIKYIPYSVIAGYLNGVAILIMLSQVGSLVGADNAGLAAVLTGAVPFRSGAVLVSGVTLASMLLGARFFRRWPAALIALVLGTGLHLVLSLFLKASSLGATIGAIPRALPQPTQVTAMKNIALAGDFSEYLLLISGPAASIAVLGSMATLLGVLFVESSVKVRYNGNRELIGLGLGNLLAACFGGLVSAGSISRTMVNVGAGARTRLSGLIHGLLLLLVATGLGSLVGLIPFAVIAAILVATAGRMMREASRELGWHRSGQPRYRQEMLFNLSVMLLVTVIVVFYDLVIALVAGLILASILFIAVESRRIVKRIYYGDQVRSKTIRGAIYTDQLQERGREIAVVELEGLIFFGSTENLFKRLETLDEQSTYIILDLKRVSRIDDNGARFFLLLNAYLKNQGRFLLVSHLTRKNFWDFFVEMQIIDAIGEDNFFADTDAALAWAEDHLLAVPADLETMPLESPLAQMDALQGFTDQQIGILREKLERLTFRKGEYIFREGETGRSLYFLAAGTVNVMIGIPGEAMKKRISSFSPGVVFGELALLEGNPRSADIMVDEDAVCYRLEAKDFRRLADEQHGLAVQLAVNIGRILSRRLLDLTNELRVLEQ